MKEFENKEVIVAKQTTTYGELLTMCLDKPPQNGFSGKEIRQRGRVAKAIDDTEDGTIKFEDADYAKALECVKAMMWAVRDDKLSTFEDDFIAAENEKQE